MITERELKREEIERVWSIDRSEIIENVYHYKNNELILKKEYYNMKGWPPNEFEIYTPHLLKCYDRDGWFYGIFDETNLIAVAVLDNIIIGSQDDLLQLKFLHVSNSYRKKGYGKYLFKLAFKEAIKRGAKGLYISATPSKNTVNFYLNLGCILTKPNPELFQLEPEDIHFECKNLVT